MSNFTTIYHKARKELELSIFEYCLADMIYHLSGNPDNTNPGWCYMSKEHMAENLGVTRQGIHKMITRLIEMGLVEKHPVTKFVRTTSKWYRAVVDAKAGQSVNSVDKDSKLSLHTDRKLSLHNSNNLDINNNKDISTQPTGWSVEDERLVKLFYSLVREHNPLVKDLSGPKNYAVMNRLHRVDGVGYEVIEGVIRWVVQSDFWQPNILSVTKLRKQFPTLFSQAKRQIESSRVVAI